MMIFFECPGCARRLQIPDAYRGKRSKCPECGAVSLVPGTPEPAPVAVRPAAVGEGTPADADTIAVVEVGPTCPNCRMVLPVGAVLCVNCGHDFRTGRQRETAHGPFEQHWTVGPPLLLRLVVLLILEFVCLLVALYLGDVLVGLALLFVGSVFLTLWLGTYMQLHVVRSDSGKVLLTRTWSLFFIPAIRHRVNVRKYDAIVIDARGRNPGPIVIMFLLRVCLYAAGFWVLSGFRWHDSLAPATYHVTLCKDRGREEFYLYYSTEDTQLRDIVSTLQELTGLRVDRR
jgi:hypothetical protein